MIRRRIGDEPRLVPQAERQGMRIESAAGLAAGVLRGAGLAGDQVRRIAADGRAGAAGLHRRQHAALDRTQVREVVGDAHGRWLRQRHPRHVVAIAPLLHEVQAAPLAVVGERRDAARELQQRHLPVALADAGNDGLADVPRLLAVLGLPFRRRHDADAFAHQVDAGGLAEAVLVHPLVQAIDAHVVGELVIVEIHRLGDRLAQVGPAGTAVRVAVAATLPGDMEFAGREHLVLRRAQAAVQAGQAEEGLDRRPRGTATDHVAVEQRSRRVVHQRAVIHRRDAVDEQVGIEARQADHGQDLAGARIHRDRRAVEVAERFRRRLLQVQVDRQAQVGARHRGHAPDRCERAAFDVGFDLLVADAPAQGVLVIAFDPGLAGVGEGRAGFAQFRQVGVVDAADIADHMCEQRAVGIAAAQVGHQVDPGIAPTVDGEARDLLVADAQLQRHRTKAAHRLAVGIEVGDVVGRQRDDARELRDEPRDVARLVGDDVEPVRRDVVGEDAALAVVNQPAPRHDRPRLDAVGLRTRGVVGVVDDLQLEIPQPQCRQ
jgi:hypothetical protein